MRTALAIVIVAVLSASVTSAQPRRSGEQESFGVGGDRPVVQHSVKLSDQELAALANDELVKQELDQDPPIPKLTREGLEAGVIHLGPPNERDLVVVGSGPPLMGANVGPFWIIRDLPTGPVVVVHAVCL